MLGSLGLPLHVTHKREESFMTKELRWRVIILQIAVIAPLCPPIGSMCLLSPSP